MKPHPEEPWLQKKDWASGILRSSAAALAGPLLFAGVWTVFCVLLWLAVRSGTANHSEARLLWWLAVAFSATDLSLIAWAAVAMLRWRKYGRSVFAMASVPGVIGGQLAGVVRVPVKIQPADAFRIRLSCVRCVTTRGSDSHVRRSNIWQDEQVVACDLLQEDAGRTAVPILFQIPFDCQPTDERNLDDVICWNLEVKAATRGIDFGVTFEVPVFKTPESDPHFVVDPSLVAQYRAAESPERDLRDARVRKMPSPTGDGWRFVFPMARHPGTAFGFTVATLFCFGAAVFWPHIDFGWIAITIGVFCGLFGLLFLFAAMRQWFYRSTVDASPRGTMVRGGLLGGLSSRWIDATDIAGIKSVSHMSSEKLVYYDLILICRDGKKVTLGKWLPGKRLATAVTDQIKQALGKKPSSVEG